MTERPRHPEVLSVDHANAAFEFLLGLALIDTTGRYLSCKPVNDRIVLVPLGKPSSIKYGAGVLANFRAATASLTPSDIGWVITAAFFATDLIQETASIQRLGRQMDKWIRRPGRFAFAVFGRNQTKNSQVLRNF